MRDYRYRRCMVAEIWPLLVYPVVIGWLVYVRRSYKKRVPLVLDYQTAITGEEAMKAVSSMLYTAGSERERLERVADVVDAWMLSRPSGGVARTELEHP